MTPRAPARYRSDPAVPAFPDDKPLIVFDGHCVLCSGWASFVVRFDVAIGAPLVGPIVRYAGQLG